MPGSIYKFKMPDALRRTPFEEPVRRVARSIKHMSYEIEKTLRRGKARCALSVPGEEIWLDFDFGVQAPPPLDDEMLPALLDALQPGDVFYDIGAFIGWYSIAAANRVGPNGRVVAFEPTPQSAALVRHHCALNDVERVVRVVEAACSRDNGMTTMAAWPVVPGTRASGNGLKNVHPKQDASPDWIPVVTMRLDDFVSNGGVAPTAMKIDVEGAELWVLLGARETLTRHRPVIFVEMHKFAWEHFDTDDGAFMDFVASVDYRMLSVDMAGELAEIPDRTYAVLVPNER